MSPRRTARKRHRRQATVPCLDARKPRQRSPRRGTSSDQAPATPGAASLSEQYRRFVEAYMGAAAGNATEAAIAAGYSRKTAASIGSRLLRKVNIRAAIAERAKSDPAVWTREDRQRFWTLVASGAVGYAKAPLRDRLKASELLGKSQADFIDRQRVEVGGTNGGPIVFEVVTNVPQPGNRDAD